MYLQNFKYNNEVSLIKLLRPYRREGYKYYKRYEINYGSIFRGDHTEITQADFDPKTITYEDLLKEFWKNHDPSHKMKAQVTRIYRSDFG